MNINDLLANFDYTGFLVKLILTLVLAGLPFAFKWGYNLYKLNEAALKQRIGERAFEQLKAIVRAGVLAAEQTGLISDVKIYGQQKKSLAIAFIQKFAEHYGFKMDAAKWAVASDLIESEVAWLFNTQGNSVVELTPEKLAELFKGVSAQLDGGSPALPSKPDSTALPDG